MNAATEPVATAARLVPLTEAVELNPRPERGALRDDLEVSFVPMAALEAATGRMDASGARPFGEVKKGYTVFREGDVLFAKITPCMENGKMAVARGLRNGVGCGSTELHVLRPRPGVDPHYVYHFVSSARFRAEAAHHMKGAVGQKRVPAAFLERCEIPLPDLGDQRRIVAEIEKQFSRLDEAVANLKRVEASLKRYSGACLHSAFDLVPQSQSTAIAILGDVVEAIVDCPHSTPKWTSEGFICIRTTDFLPGRLDLSAPRFVSRETFHQRNARLVPRAGDILYSREGGILGIACEVPVGIELCLGQRMLLIRAGQRVLSRFVMHWLNSRHILERVRVLVGGSASPHLNVRDIRAFPVPVPTLEEQGRVVAEVDRRLSIVREVESEIDANLQRARLLRRAVLARAFQIMRLGA